MPTVTLDELAIRTLGLEISAAFDRVELEVVDRDGGSSSQDITLDALGKKVLGPDVDQALSEVDVHHEGFRISLHTPRWSVEVQLRGFSLLILALALASTVVGASSLIEMLRVVFISN